MWLKLRNSITALSQHSEGIIFENSFNKMYKELLVSDFPLLLYVFLIAYNLCYPISNDEISVLVLLHPELPDLTSAKVLAQFG